MDLIVFLVLASAREHRRTRSRDRAFADIRREADRLRNEVDRVTLLIAEARAKQEPV